MKHFVVMRQLTGPCGAWSEPVLSFSSKEEAEKACKERTAELKDFAACTLNYGGRDTKRSVLELLTALGLDGIGYHICEMDTREADLLQAEEKRIILS